MLGRRFPAIPVVIYPTAVQGDAAAREIAAAIDTAARRGECDVLIVGRGGGSLEDLWPFNEEVVARAIAACPIPVVSAVGHETDVTITDFVADVRAPTPSGAAERVAPDQAEWLRQLERTSSRLGMLGRRVVEDRYQAVDWLSRRLSQGSPAAMVARQRDWLNNLRQVMTAAIRHDLHDRMRRVEQFRSRLIGLSPAVSVQQSIGRMTVLRQRLHAAMARNIGARASRLSLSARALDSVSPLATLERGYAIVTDADKGHVLTDASQASAGSRIRARLMTGEFVATVTESKHEAGNDD